MICIPNSQRLSFSLIQDNDIDLLFQLEKDAEVMRFINGGKPASLQEVLDVSLPRLQKYRNEEKGWGLWQVNEISTDEYVGWILIRPENYFNDQPTDESNLEIGWRFKQSSWGKGYATEAAKAIMEAVSHHTGVNRFHAIADKSNQASIKIMTKLGMTFKKDFLHQDVMGDQMAVYYEMYVN